MSFAPLRDTNWHRTGTFTFERQEDAINRPFAETWLLLLLLAGCAQTAPAYAPVPAVVPQAEPETVPLPPVSSKPLLWQPGHYEWDGAQFVWYKGEWIERGDRSTLWQDGYWQKDGNTFVWVPGHWAS